MSFPEVKKMELGEYDGQCVRVTDSFGYVFEGVCEFNGEEYSEHEYGRREEALQIEGFLFSEAILNALKALRGVTDLTDVSLLPLA